MAHELIKTLGLLLMVAVVARAQTPSEDPRALFDAAWTEARDSIYPETLAEHFDESTRKALRGQVETADDVVDVLAPFLRSLGVSHTDIFDDRSEEFDLLRSLFRYRDPDRPEISALGIQWGDGGRVRAVLDGLPAERYGVRVGDRLLSVDGEPYTSRRQWQGREQVQLQFERDGEAYTRELEPRRIGVQRAYLEASRNSERVYRCGDRRIGYFHLWAGTDPAFLESLEAAVHRFSGSTDGLVLDLRDGYGGAWWAYLEPFFADTEDFFVATIESRGGQVQTLEPPRKSNPDFYDKPMVVLINGGTRSGKESLAYQFRKSGRATLMGATTAGAFSSGQGIFADRDWPLVMYVAVNELILDGSRIEGVGVAPHVRFTGSERALRSRALARAAGLARCEEPE